MPNKNTIETLNNQTCDSKDEIYELEDKYWGRKISEEQKMRRNEKYVHKLCDIIQ